MRKTYAGKTIISDCAFQLKSGEVKGLIGRNGSGKSTLMEILFGLKKADTIFFKFDEKVIQNRRQFSRYFFYSPQYSILPKNKTVHYLAKLSLEKHDLKTFFEDQHIRDLSQQKIKTLSKGTRDYVRSSLALNSSKPFLLLDEPFQGLSPILAEHLAKKIKKTSAGKGILVSSHRHQPLKNCCSQVIELKNGNLVDMRYHK